MVVGGQGYTGIGAQDVKREVAPPVAVHHVVVHALTQPSRAHRPWGVGWCGTQQMEGTDRWELGDESQLVYCIGSCKVANRLPPSVRTSLPPSLGLSICLSFGPPDGSTRNQFSTISPHVFIINENPISLARAQRGLPVPTEPRTDRGEAKRSQNDNDQRATTGVAGKNKTAEN